MPYLGERVLQSARLWVSLDLVAEALQLPPRLVESLFRDGSTVQRLAECWAAKKFGTTPRPSRNAPTPDKVVVLTENGVAFSQSATRGVGRSGSSEGLQDYLDSLNRLVVVDACGFPNVRLWELSLPVVRQWLQDTGSSGTVSRATFLRWLGPDAHTVRDYEGVRHAV